MRTIKLNDSNISTIVSNVMTSDEVKSYVDSEIAKALRTSVNMMGVTKYGVLYRKHKQRDSRLRRR